MITSDTAKRYLKCVWSDETLFNHGGKLIHKFNCKHLAASYIQSLVHSQF